MMYAIGPTRPERGDDRGQTRCFGTQTLQERQGLMVACPEEIAYRMGYISRTQLISLANVMKKNGYGKYLLQLAAE